MLFSRRRWRFSAGWRRRGLRPAQRSRSIRSSQLMGWEVSLRPSTTLLSTTPGGSASSRACVGPDCRTSDRDRRSRLIHVEKETSALRRGPPSAAQWGIPASGGLRAYRRRQGRTAPRPIEASKAAVCYVRNTSIRAVQLLSAMCASCGHPLIGWHHERYRYIGLRSMAERDGCATSDRSGSDLRTRPLDPE
jgi:hypothetical protein